MLTRGMAKELGPHGIRVNCVNPTAVENTDMAKQIFDVPPVLDAFKQATPLGKFPGKNISINFLHTEAHF